MRRDPAVFTAGRKQSKDFERLLVPVIPALKRLKQKDHCGLKNLCHLRHCLKEEDSKGEEIEGVHTQGQARTEISGRVLCLAWARKGQS